MHMTKIYSNFTLIAGALALSATFAVVAFGGLIGRGRQQAPGSPAASENTAPAQVSGFYCNLKALTPAERAHHGLLTLKLMGAKLETKELPDGYGFRFDAGSVSLAELADWVANEKKCCPFFDFDIQLERNGGALWLKLSGSDGVKQFIRSEFKFPAPAEEDQHE
jgi:hypothetical protein